MGKARRAWWPTGDSIDKALAEGVQPNHLAAEPDRLDEQSSIAGERNPQRRVYEIGREAGGVGGMGRD